MVLVPTIKLPAATRTTHGRPMRQNRERLRDPERPGPPSLRSNAQKGSRASIKLSNRSGFDCSRLPREIAGVEICNSRGVTDTGEGGGSAYRQFLRESGRPHDDPGRHVAGRPRATGRASISVVAIACIGLPPSNVGNHNIMHPRCTQYEHCRGDTFASSPAVSNNLHRSRPSRIEVAVAGRPGLRTPSRQRRDASRDRPWAASSSR